MKTRFITLALAAAIAAGAGQAADAEQPTATAKPTDAMSRENGGLLVEVCFNGLQAGKVIVRDGRVDDEVETTAKACRIDGGDAASVPRSPIIPAGSAAIA